MGEAGGGARLLTWGDSGTGGPATQKVQGSGCEFLVGLG